MGREEKRTLMEVKDRVAVITGGGQGRHSLELGAQNLWAGSGIAHTGEVSARLLTDAGMSWKPDTWSLREPWKGGSTTTTSKRHIWAGDQ